MRRCHEPGRRRRPALAKSSLLLVVVLIGGCARLAVETPPEETTPEMTTTRVTRQDLIVNESLDGRLGYGVGFPLNAGRDGMVTWIPKEGTLLRRGDVMVELDGIATRVLYGDRPAWRRLDVYASDGPDIRQLNDNLAALGYSERDDLSEDRFDWLTKEAVRDWQEDLGLTRTGVVELGDVAFLPERFRLGAIEVRPGTMVGIGQLLAHGTGTKKLITLEVDATRQVGLSRGTRVKVALPDKTRVDGVVRSVGKVASAGDDAPTIKVVVEPTHEQELRFEAAPVSVIVERILAKDALVVPVGALLASTDGGYVVERVVPGGTELVRVQPGEFGGGLVEIKGDVDEGDQVVVPR